MKDTVRWRTPAWTKRTCERVADAVLASAEKYNLSPALILAVMLNESDLDEKAATPYFRGGAVYAKDSGLMGIRCVFDGRGRCGNGHVRGMRARDVADPVTNIELGARELAYTRDKGGVERRTVRVRGNDGKITTRTKLIRCRHLSHAYWAHYNHGSFYRSAGYARHYPHRVAVLYYALARSLGLPADEVTSGPITIRDKGARARTADRPIEARYRTLASKIYEATPRCGVDDSDNTVFASTSLD
ncbi:MAG TPA: transglycosylase SLT domain-containing protein [Polyangia bacterium]